MNRLVPAIGIALLTTTLAICQSTPRQPVDEGPEIPAPILATAAATSGDEGLKLLLPPVPNPLGSVGRIDKRIFGIIPNHRAEQETSDYKPLQTWQKFKIAERDTFDWPNFPLMAGFALQTQIAERGWHGTAVGRNFAQYYARSFADALIGNYVTEALMPTLFHEDPRFFRSGVGPVWKRTFKAARQIVVTRKEDGRQGFNISEIAGNSAVVALTSIYYPDSRRLGPAAARVGLQVGNDVISNLLTEFWPDVKRHLQPLLHHHRVD